MPDHPSSPSVPVMKVSTTIWSLRLSLWKQVVKISFSSASLHIGSLCDRQKARLHIAQVAGGARVVSDGCEDVGGTEPWADKGMMVLLVKQVHLQKDGGAGYVNMCLLNQATDH